MEKREKTESRTKTDVLFGFWRLMRMAEADEKNPRELHAKQRKFAS